MNNDRIERNITIAATTQRVWEVISAPEHVVRNGSADRD